MSRYFIKLSYKGTKYYGWQVQPGKVTIQGELSRAIELLLNEKIEITGAGRTDTGVHALNYFAHFDSEKLQQKNIPEFIQKINRFLSADIFIQAIVPVNSSFHARYAAVSRTYHYLISTSKNPFLQDFSLFLPHTPDIDAMNKACGILMKYNDFASFSKLHSDNKTTICTLKEAEWRQINPDLLVFRITADRFLRNMVRAVVGTLLKIGDHKIPVEALDEIIAKKDRSAAGMSAKAKGLFLTNIQYKDIQLSENSYHWLNESFFF